MTITALLIAILVEGGTITGLPTFHSYRELVDAGYYYSPGFDCQATVSEAEVAFSATKDETKWAIFVMEKVALDISFSGYRIRQLVEDQLEGERIDCRASLVEDLDKSNDLVEIHRQYGGDFDSPDYVTFVLGRGGDEKLEAMSCGWSYGPGEAFWENDLLFASYQQQDGKRVTKQAGKIGACFASEGDEGR